MVARMISRRTLLIGLASAPLGACNSTQGPALKAGFLGDVGESYTRQPSDKPQDSSPNGEIVRPTHLARKTVPYHGSETPGTILVKTRERQLYLVLEDETAIQYPVGVGKAGKQWQGRTEVDGAYVQPAWAPTPEIKRDNPSLPDVIPGGAPNNPMGERVLTLSGGDYAIHGTNRPESIGTYASYGCIRMFNDDIVDLFKRVRVGTQVLVSA